jgi:hypothetical protein
VIKKKIKSWGKPAVDQLMKTSAGCCRKSGHFAGYGNTGLMLDVICGRCREKVLGEG